MTEFKNWVAPKATPLLVASLAMLMAPTLRAEAAVIKNLRIGDNKGYVRMVLELDRPLTRPPSFSIQRDTLQIALTGIIDNLSALQSQDYRNGIVSLDVSKSSKTTRIDVVFPFVPADIKSFSLTGPHRFIVDAYRPVSTSLSALPIEKAQPTELIEGNVSLPEPDSEPEKQAPTGALPSIDERSTKARGSSSSTRDNADDWRRNQIQQWLIAALIVVTSIIVALLYFLIRMGGAPRISEQPSWIRYLPPTRDRNIQVIDSEIRKHLKNQDRQ